MDMKLEMTMAKVEKRMRMKRAVLAFLVAAALAMPAAPGALAQAGGGTPAMTAPAPAPAPAAMPMPTPSPALDQLKFFAGKWQCAGTGYLEGKGHPITAAVHMEWDLNGFFMNLRYEEKKSDVNPMPITAVEHWGYSPELKKLVAGQVDNTGGYGTQATAGWEGDKMVWVGNVHMMGTTIPSRDTFVRSGDNEVTHLGELEQNGAWVKQDQQTCLRVK
jgi:hypothetical protein